MTPRIVSKSVRYRLRVDRSHIHRFGVFAEEEIPAGQRVIEYRGRRITNIQANRIKSPREEYLADLNSRWVLDPSVGGSGAEFINHSCDPNLEWRRIRGRLFYFSCRKIKIGEELTSDYKNPSHLVRVPCHCGARNCRGTLRYLLD
jgi:uncharacterized protein